MLSAHLTIHLEQKGGLCPSHAAGLSPKAANTHNTEGNWRCSCETRLAFQPKERPCFLGCFWLFLPTSSAVVFWFLLSLHQYLNPLQAGVTKALSFECVGQNWRKLIGGFFSIFLSPWPSFFFSPWFHFCLLQKVHDYSSYSTADPSSSFSVVPEKGTTLFHLHLAAWSLQPPA